MFKEHITSEMRKYFLKRTKKHIEFYDEMHDLMYEHNLINKKEYREMSFNHDASKFSKEEKEPYILLTWKYKMQQEGNKYDYPSEQIKKAVKKATFHHVKNNPHHVEYWDKTVKIGNDKPVDATKMPRINLLEMVCDWFAMTRELGGNTYRWASDFVNKHEFTHEQSNTILSAVMFMKVNARWK